MPKPRPGEKRKDYLQRAIKVIRQEEPEKDMNAVLGKAYGLWNTYQKGAKRNG